MSMGLVYIQEPGLARRQVGKFLRHGSMGVYVFDGPTVYRRLQALGIAETVLAAMMVYGYSRVDYILDGHTYSTSLDAALCNGFRDPFPRAGYWYVKLRDWRVTPGRQPYTWVTASAHVDLPWVVNSATLNARRELVMAEATEAARPAGIQMALMAA